ncbi:MAG: ABC transporter ATP-binding protein [Oscillatoria sp. SIO1A7]|nr:ABC transporter ATP-binding protein [Oscillatoria sp. SIO1A7]
MDNTVIEVENLGKKYVIGHHKPDNYSNLGDVIANGVKSLGQKLLRPTDRQKSDSIEFWALKGVSFQIKQGEVVGIIGRNGAGKSTLLKILSRITEPTTGRVKINGRVASLLEVGTGFHPELTGRENIYLNGSILGMSKVEIKKKFDEIVAFAEVEKFIDTPVKRYSSGMYVRLAFAVAAHLEPEILVLDEVLAVGDVEFQKKCLGKMGEVATREKRTVLFVSHNLSSILQLCTQGILLDTGKLLFNGNIQQTIEEYINLNSFNDRDNGSLSDATLRTPYSNPNSLIKWSNIQIVNLEGKKIKEVGYKEPFEIVCQCRAFDKC